MRSIGEHCHDQAVAPSGGLEPTAPQRQWRRRRRPQAGPRPDGARGPLAGRFNGDLTITFGEAGNEDVPVREFRHLRNDLDSLIKHFE